jgi:hypothetical protein
MIGPHHEVEQILKPNEVDDSHHQDADHGKDRENHDAVGQPAIERR